MQKYRPLVRVGWEELTGESRPEREKEKWLWGSLSLKLITRMDRGGVHHR